MIGNDNDDIHGEFFEVIGESNVFGGSFPIQEDVSVIWKTAHEVHTASEIKFRCSDAPFSAIRDDIQWQDVIGFKLVEHR